MREDKYTIELPVFPRCLSGTGIIKVTPSSPQDERDALEQFARYFKQEKRYIGIQYEANSHTSNTIGFLFTENAMDIEDEEYFQQGMPTRCSGGCTFQIVDDVWVLCWIWLHPFYREQGVLSTHWNTFVSDMGNFSIESPISNSMEHFLKKHPNHKVIKLPSM
ncbi:MULTISPECIES: hypothetical protein [Vibrio]|uniref:hypothetical protein n=1 Tax=Vibrio TaxID=662 RepID=UPI000C817656|nr:MULTISPECIES: hypothetical protein [Vibrio]PMG96104.1 hypothetical protein BCU79_07725 [Vibrio breoganii]